MSSTANELAWRFLAATRTATRYSFPEGSKEGVAYTYDYNLMQDLKMMAVVLTLARLQDAKARAVTSADLLACGLPLTAMNTKLKWLRDNRDDNNGPSIKVRRNGNRYTYELVA